MNSVTARREVVSHCRAALGVVALTLALITALMFDRRPPFEYISTTIEPSPAVEGEAIEIHRHVVWHRTCDGEIYKEIVRPSGRIADYDRGYRPFPARMGRQRSAPGRIVLPRDMLEGEGPRGVAIYRGRVRFPACGLTSRIWPIEVPFQEIPFEVVRRP